jgi:hypothetical protein
MGYPFLDTSIYSILDGVRAQAARSKQIVNGPSDNAFWKLFSWVAKDFLWWRILHIISYYIPWFCTGTAHLEETGYTTWTDISGPEIASISIRQTYHHRWMVRAQTRESERGSQNCFWRCIICFRLPSPRRPVISRRSYHKPHSLCSPGVSC